MKKLLALAALITFLLPSCNQDESETGELNADDASAQINATAQQMGDDIISLVESDGANALLKLVELLDGSETIGARTSGKAWTKKRLDLIIQYFVNGPASKTSNDDPTSFEDIKGLYEWNPELGDFDKTESQFFIVLFPTEGSQTNNAELKISDLQFETFTDFEDGFEDSYQVPIIIEGYLKVDEVTLVSLSFEVEWTNGGEPVKADVNLFILPFDFQLVFDDSFEASASLLASISIDGENITSIDVDVQFEDNTKEEPVYLEGSVSYRAVKIAGNIDVRDIGDDADPNDYINLELYYDGSKLGDIVFELEEIEDGYQDYVAYVIYEDGTSENLEEVLEPVFEEIEEIFEDFED